MYVIAAKARKLKQGQIQDLEKLPQLQQLDVKIAVLKKLIKSKNDPAELSKNENLQSDKIL